MKRHLKTGLVKLFLCHDEALKHREDRGTRSALQNEDAQHVDTHPFEPHGAMEGTR